MAEATDPQSPAEPEAPEPVSASAHLGVDPVVPEPADEPVEAEIVEAEVLDEPEPLVEPESEAVPLVEPVTTEVAPQFPIETVAAVPAAPEPVPAGEPVGTPPAVVPAAREVVYVQAPTPPAHKHNRGFGVLMSLLGAVVFALLYLGASSIVIGLTPGVNAEGSITGFLTSDVFWVPVAAYAAISVLFALIVDRAAWWAHVLGSLLVAGLVYGVSLGVLALLRNVVAMTPDEAVALFSSVAGSAFLLAALVLARETALWFGLAISARGRRVKERNAAERARFEQSVAEQRSEYERAHPSA